MPEKVREVDALEQIPVLDEEPNEQKARPPDPGSHLYHRKYPLGLPAVAYCGARGTPTCRVKVEGYESRFCKECLRISKLLEFDRETR